MWSPPLAIVGVIVGIVAYALWRYGQLLKVEERRRRGGRHVRELLVTLPYTAGLSLIADDPILAAEYAALDSEAKAVIQAILDLRRRLESPALTDSERGLILGGASTSSGLGILGPLPAPVPS